MKMQIDKLLAVLLLVSGLALMPNGTWADEETELDTTTPPSEEPTDEPTYTGLPKISVYPAADKIIIMVEGMTHDVVEAVLFDGIDISDLLETLAADGIVEREDRDDGFQLLVNIPPDQFSSHEFTLAYLGDNRLSVTIDGDKLFEQLTDNDKGFGRTRVYGKAVYRSRCGWWIFKRDCWRNASNVRVEFFLLINNRWQYRGSTYTNSGGNYNVYLDGYDSPRMLIVGQFGNFRVIRRIAHGPVCTRCPAWVGRNFYFR